ncbi:MAG TPA: hypothetical protein VN934_04430 [Candidatus Tumulicola sp.]|nr:hypothetical protein [Candidatus Tumulicola sp.]
MAKILLLQFHTDPGCDERRKLLADLGATLVEAEPRWPTFFDVVTQERPDVIVISCATLPSHGREAARYIKDGFNTRNIPAILTDVAPSDLDKTRQAAPTAEIIDRKGLAEAVKRHLKILAG